VFSAVSASRLAGERPLSVRHRGISPALPLFQSVAVALDHQGVTVMQQSVENGGGEDVIAEDGARCVTN